MLLRRSDPDFSLIDHVERKIGISMTASGVTLADRDEMRRHERDAEFTTYRVLHVVDESLPLVSGYAIRTNGIVQAQAALGNHPVVLTSPVHQSRDNGAVETTIDRVKYLRTPMPGSLSGAAIRKRWPVFRELSLVNALERRILEVLDAETFDVVHAHSPSLCGLAATRAAKKKNIPVLYEIRAFWEDAAVDQGKTTKRSPRYQLSRRLEQHVINSADSVVGIASHILEDLVGRGVSRDKLFHVGNGVDTLKFQPVRKSEALAAKHGLLGVPVLGFIGSLFYFEGISWLVRAASALHKQGAQFKLVIIGHGEEEAKIRQEIESLGASSYVLFLGKVPHHEVIDYYSIMDVLVYPRRSNRLTELVTPLKPLEAMALKRTVLGSSVGGIRELVDNEATGLLFKPEDVQDFCRQAARLIESEELRTALAAKGRNYVERQRDWKQLATKYESIYGRMLGRQERAQ
jgi:PEP-CTERM/exosortase A-associated glycosyltransferase